MTAIKFFWKHDCPKCPEAKHIFNCLKEEGFKVMDYNLNTADGLAESAYHNVLSTPTFLVIDDNDREVLQWRGDVPTFEELIAILMSHDVKPQCTC